MRLIDGDPSQLTLRVNDAEDLAEILQLAVLWGHIKEAGEWVSAL
jgi:hypothetical protein